ncbi:Meckelin, partial [Stegodyphus mimosarum]
MYPIPVLIRGINVNGEFVNMEYDKSKWLLVRRFFLTDPVSGIEEGANLIGKSHQPIAKVFRYAADVSLKITLRPNGKSGMIYPPLLTISYAEA